MKVTELGHGGPAVSALALGCMGMGTRADDETSFATLDAYAEDGGAFLDTADCYAWFYAQGSTGGQSEELIGRWLKRSGRRDSTFLATKGAGMITNPEQTWPLGADEADWGKADFVGAGGQTLRTALEGSLRRLGTDHIDLYYVHVDDRSTPLEESLAALAGFVAEGKVRYLGWSNVRTWRLERIRALCAANGWPQPVALQQLHSYLRQSPGTGDISVVGAEQLDYLRDRGDLGLVAYSPLLKGAYDEPSGRRAQLLRAGPAETRRLAVLDDVTAELGASPGQVVLAWLAGQRSPGVIPLIGSTRVERYREARRAMELSLTPEQMARLDAA